MGLIVLLFAWLLLAALAATSTDAMVRRLGGSRWRRLHQAVYLIALLALIHYFQQTKADVTVPTFAASLFLWLMGYRLLANTGKRAGQEYTDHNWERRLHTGPNDRELLTRQEMVHGAGSRPGHAPDVLVTNYSMLEYMLMRPFERPVFAETKRWLDQDGTQLLLVLDEAHMYRGAKGAEVAFLIRRLRARLGTPARPTPVEAA